MTQRSVRPGVHEHRRRAAGTEIDTNTDTDRVRLVTLAQAGHFWPGSTYIEHRREFGVCDDIDATAVLLDFFDRPRSEVLETSAPEQTVVAQRRHP